MYWEDMPVKRKDCITSYISNCFNTYLKDVTDAFYNYNNLIGNYEMFYLNDSGVSLMEKIVCYYFHQKLRNNNTFKTNYRPNWLKNEITGNNLELDVYWESDSVKYAVEYNGYPHVLSKSQQIRDELKKSLCKENNVCLYTIQAYTLSTIDDVSLVYFYSVLNKSYRSESQEYQKYLNSLYNEIKVRNILNVCDKDFVEYQKVCKEAYLLKLKEKRLAPVLDEWSMNRYSFINLIYPVLYSLFQEIFHYAPSYINEQSYFKDREKIKRYIVYWFIHNKSMYHYLEINKIYCKVDEYIYQYLRYMKFVSGLRVIIDDKTYITISDIDKRNLKIYNNSNLLEI